MGIPRHQPATGSHFHWPYGILWVVGWAGALKGWVQGTEGALKIEGFVFYIEVLTFVDVT